MGIKTNNVLPRSAVENADTLAELDAVSMGKPVFAHTRESMIAANHLKHAADLAETYLGGTASTNTPGFFNFSLKVPYGVVAGICRELKRLRCIFGDIL